MQRLLSVLATLAIAFAPAAVAGAFAFAPTTTNTTATTTASKPAAKTTTSTTTAVATTGNGAPSGAHYNLNIIGVPKQKSADMTGSNGHVIFVSLAGNTKINLSAGDFL